MLIITPQSHLDHGLELGHVRLLLELFGDRSEFFAETVNIPAGLGWLPCSLRGPAVGMAPIPEEAVVYELRPGRSWTSRLLAHLEDEPLLSPLLTVIGGPGDAGACVLYTAFGGPLAPREPGDPSLSAEELTVSEAFWSQHALTP
jgi:hypothetical protein